MIREDRMRGYAAALPHIRAAIKAYHEATRPTVVTDEVVERDELLDLLELAGDYAADVFNSFRDKTGPCALRVAANLERFNKAHAAIAAMSSQEGE